MSRHMMPDGHFFLVGWQGGVPMGFGPFVDVTDKTPYRQLCDEDPWKARYYARLFDYHQGPLGIPNHHRLGTHWHLSPSGFKTRLQGGAHT